MKKILFIFLGALSSAGVANAATGSQVRVRLVMNRVEHPVTMADVQLRAENSELHCSAQGTPEHRVDANDFLSLKPPFKASSQATLDACSQILMWNETKSCVDHEPMDKVQALFRWCAQI